MSRTTKTRLADQALRSVPLARAIASELSERTQELARLERELSRAERGPMPEARRVALRRDLEARIAVQRRALRLAEKELARLRWHVESHAPLQLVHLGEDGRPDLSFAPEEAGYDRVSS
jgi:hypothetical protein